jgi:mannose-1-phosphate guanylyltransferase
MDSDCIDCIRVYYQKRVIHANLMIFRVRKLEKYAVVMAGGTGSRLWPISREKRPKQFISAGGDKCMLIHTLERISQVVPLKNCFVVTSRELAEITQRTLEDQIPVSNIIIEPLRKNTAACISYAALLLYKKVKSGAVCFFPADGYIKDESEHRVAIRQAYKTAEDTSGLVIIGIAPTYPSTGYGYIKVDAESEKEIYPVKRFTEKPDSEKAARFLAEGNYWWNSGIVAGNLQAFADHIQLFLPEHYKELSEAVDGADGKDAGTLLKNAYAKIPSISFDIGVLEQSADVLAVKGLFDWDDIGSLDSLSVILSEDSDGNKVKGNFLGIDTKNSIIYGNKALVTAIGMDNTVIAVTDDAVLVCPRDRAQDVKHLVDRLKSGDFEGYT